MKNLLLDHHQGSHCDTITIGLEGMMNWVLQLNNSQSVNSFNSLVEVQHETFAQPTQPKPKPICDRSGKLENTEDVFVIKGETSRSHEIDEKGLHEELGSSHKSGKPEKMSENIRVKRAHDGTGQPVVQNSSSVHTVKKQFVPEGNRDIASFNADNEFNRALNEENIDFNIPGVPNSTVKRSHGVNVRNLIQKTENHPQRHALQSDLQQHRQFNPFSKESRDVIKAVGNTELCELLDVEPKAQCKVWSVVLDVGIVYCTCGHFLRDGTTENKKYSTSGDLFSIPNIYIRKGRPHGHRYGKKEGDHECFIANQLKKKCKKREFLSIHDRFIRDARFRKTMIELGRTEEVIREMDKLANEDHTHHVTEEETSVYRSNWWIRSNFVGSDTMPVRHRADFKEALSTLRRLKNQEDQHTTKIGETVIGPIIRGMILNINLMQNYSDQFGNSQQQITVTDGGCKEYISHTGKFHAIWLRRKRQ